MAEVTQILCPKCHKANLRRARFCQHCGHDIVLNNDVPSDERRYVITQVLKQGGQGAVYVGIDEGGKLYAIKEMSDTCTDPRERAEAIERFNHEAETLQRLSHPRIPRVYSHFRDEGRHYLTMDFVHGEDLEQLVEREGKLDERQVLIWADQLCAVLSYLHGNNLIYRDMKPSNVMVKREDGGIQMVDFGITRLFTPSERGAQIGTPGYAPPEQYQGLATPQSDIYALGATLHHLLTGRDPTEHLPFSFPRADSLPGVKVSKRTADALERALQKVPQDRFATVAEFWEALRPTQASAASEQPQRGQVRVAPAPARPAQAAAAKLGAPPSVAAGPKPRSVPGAQPPARSVGPNPAPRRGFLARVRAFISGLVRTVLLIALLAVVALGVYVYFERPAWAEPYIAPVIELLPGEQASVLPALPTGPITRDIQVSLPADADEASIREALRDTFVKMVEAEYGSDVTVNEGSVRIVGSYDQLVAPAGQRRYSASVQGSLLQE